MNTKRNISGNFNNFHRKNRTENTDINTGKKGRNLLLFIDFVGDIKIMDRNRSKLAILQKLLINN